jgi:hypothetical protein
VSLPKKPRIYLGLGGTNRKFITDLRVLASPLNILTILLKLEFESNFENKDNRVKFSATLETFKALITLDPYLALTRKDINTFII